MAMTTSETTVRLTPIAEALPINTIIEEVSAAGGSIGGGTYGVGVGTYSDVSGGGSGMIVTVGIWI